MTVMKDPSARELMERQGGDPVTSTPEEFQRFIKEEYARFATAIKLAGLKVE
jgi:tripartite-type tricarboxylate transporter receptor subunit TctC